ncbi:MAG TPA: O-antigen ligase family protein, partial [Pirellulaceae bacterium]
HDWRRSFPDQVPIPQHAIEGYLIPLLLYGMARLTIPTEKDLRWLYWVWGAFGCYLAVTAVLEVTQHWGLVFPRYIADPSLGIHFGRARGPFLQSVRLGVFLNAALAAIWIPLVWQRRGKQAGLVAGLMLSGAVVLGTILTYTRSIWLGLVLGIVLVVKLTFHQPFRRVVLYAMIAVAVLAMPLKDRFLNLDRELGSQETLESSRMRAVFAYVSWLMFQDRPLAGFGFGHFPHEKLPYLNDRDTELRLESIRDYIHHNSYLSLLVELGGPGLAVYLMVLWSWGRLSWRLWHDQQAPDWMRGQALFGLVVLSNSLAQMAFHEVSYSPFENGVLFLVAGTVSGLCRGRKIGLTSRSSGSWEQQISRGTVLLRGHPAP